MRLQLLKKVCFLFSILKQVILIFPPSLTLNLLFFFNIWVINLHVVDFPLEPVTIIDLNL